MYKTAYTKRFLKELSKLPGEIRGKAETIAFEELIGQNPFAIGYVEQMKGYPNKYKIRLGPYRIGLTIVKSSKTIVFERIAHRKDIYKIFP